MADIVILKSRDLTPPIFSSIPHYYFLAESPNKIQSLAGRKGRGEALVILV